MTNWGFDDVSERELFYFAVPTLSELPPSFSLPSKQFVALLVERHQRD